jgi:hypothetical protein
MGSDREADERLARLLKVSLYGSTSVVLLLAWLPAALWVAFVVGAVRAWAFLGYWPSYGHPDPKDLPTEFGPVPEWMEVASFPLAAAALTCFSLYCFRQALPKRWWLWAAVGLWPLAWLLVYELARIDPGGVLDWAFD